MKSNENDFLDAEAIAEAVDRQNMRFVPIKTDDQLDLQALHRVRDRLISRRTAVINQLRAFLLERGMTFAKTPAKRRTAMPEILENAEANLTPHMRNLVHLLWVEWKGLEQQIVEMNLEVEQIASTDAGCQRLQQIAGIGPLIATAIVAAIGNGAAFHKGREFASWVGLVPRQYSTGGKARLLGISKRGNRYLRKILKSFEKGTGICALWRLAWSATGLHTAMLDGMELSEHAENAIKFLSDTFSARLYKLAESKIGVPDYKTLGSIDI